jgi:hypothetical protein
MKTIKQIGEKGNPEDLTPSQVVEIIQNLYELKIAEPFFIGMGWIEGYNIYRPEDEDCDDSVDSCWGFYGHKYCLEEAKSIVDWNIENDKKQEKLINSCMSL